MHELLTPAEMAMADRLTVENGTPGIVLMRRAGQAVAAAAAAMLPARGIVTIVAGTGNNGGDGFIAAECLKRLKHKVRVLLIGDASAIGGDALTAFQEWSGETVEATPAVIGTPHLVMDAIFGAGLNRPISGTAAEMISAINAGDAPVLAIDLPSGIDGECGAVRGHAVKAARTITFFRLKPGHLLYPGRAFCGETALSDIGIAPSVLTTIDPKTSVNTPGLWQAAFPMHDSAAHKYGRGHALTVSGGPASTGAARLAAKAALRAGAGLSTLASPKNALLVNAAHLTAVMLKPCDDADALSALLADPRIAVTILGPGLGLEDAQRQMVDAALSADTAIVLDADALSLFKDDPHTLFDRLKARKRPSVLTPHEGEFKRLFPDILEEEDRSKPDRARKAAERSGAVIVLKGADTVVASPDGRAAINANAPSALATAGSGDVLAGVIGGLLAQGMPAFEAAAAGVYLHGAAGCEAGPGLIAEDLDGALRSVISRFHAERA